MIVDEFKLRPRYGEVDKMGYVYHANYVSYCHQARTELMRKIGINDNILEQHGVILPVTSFEINYKKPAYYDDVIIIKTFIHDIPEVRFKFNFEIWKENGILISTAKSTVVFAHSSSRKPMVIPDFVKKALLLKFENESFRPLPCNSNEPIP